MRTEKVVIGGVELSNDSEPIVIAEIGNNHDGDKKQAISLIQAAARAGADMVKFQTYRADRLVAPHHELHSFFSKFALPYEWHEELKACAEAEGVLFFSTPFDRESLALLIDLGVPAIKIASSDLTNLPLIRAAAAHGLPMLVSTGMATLYEIGKTIEMIHQQGNRQIVILQCESRYPAPVETANLSMICEYIRLFKTPAGFSDHSLSIHLPVAATAHGARVIEKHFTLSRDLDGPDHAVALEPDEFASMAKGCREAVQALGNRQKEITDEIREVRQASIRGLYAARDIKQGETLTEDMIVALRPAGEVTVDMFARITGRQMKESIPKGMPLTKSSLLED